MAEPVLREIGMIAAELEVTKGVLVAPDAADAGIEVYDPEVVATHEMAPRETVEATFDGREDVPGNTFYTATFRVPFKGSGAAGTVGEVSKLLRACSTIEAISAGVSVIYTVQTPFATQETITLDVYKDGKRWRLIGAMGNCVMVWEQNGVPIYEFTFLGQYTNPTDTPILSGIVYGAVNPPSVLSVPVLWNAVAPIATRVSVDFGNDVQMRQDIAEATGFRHAMIVNRAPRIEFDPEERTEAIQGFITDWVAGTAAAFTATLGSVAGNIHAISLPNAQIESVSPGERNGLMIHTVSLKAFANSDAGDDSLVLSET